MLYPGLAHNAMDTQAGALTRVGVRIDLGLITLVMVTATARILAGHFSPAVMLAFVLARHFSGARF